MSQRLPIPGSDDGAWGGILNSFLSVSLNADGTLNSTAVSTALPSPIPTGKLGSGTASSSNFLRGDGTWAVPNGGSSSLASDTDVAIVSPADRQVLTYSATDNKWENVAPAVISVAGHIGIVTLGEGDITNLSSDLAGKLTASNNLSDVVDKAAARTNLGLGTASTESVTAFAQTANNLNDLSSPTSALGNIGGAPLASPAFTGVPTAPTATLGTNTTQVATTAFVETAVPTSLPPFTTFTAAATTPIAMAAGTVYTANAGASVFNLPASITAGQMFAVQRGTSTATITINANTGQTINGGASGGSISLSDSNASLVQLGFVWLLATSTTTYEIVSAVGNDFGAGWIFSGEVWTNSVLRTGGLLSLQGGLVIGPVIHTSTATTAVTETWSRCTTNSFTLTLGTTSRNANFAIITNENTVVSGNVITLATASGTIDLTTLPPLSGALLMYDGTNWHTIGSWGTAVPNQIFTVTTPAVSGGAVTIPDTSRINNIVVSATTAITIATTGAVDGQQLMVRITDGGTAETLSWVNTENSMITAPLTSPASSTLPTTVGFQYNGGTSKWRCIGLA